MNAGSLLADERSRDITPRASPEEPPPALLAPSRNARTFAMGRRIEGDITLYAAALRLMDDLPTGGLDRACELGIRLHAMMQARGEATAGVDFVEIASDLLDD